MSRNRAVGGRAETALVERLRRRGLRFSTNVPHLPGRPDIVFEREKLCVFCDGDFWHGRFWPARREALQGRANAEYWIAKIASNRARDARQRSALRRRGWSVMGLWETDILRSPERAADRVVRVTSRHQK